MSLDNNFILKQLCSAYVVDFTRGWQTRLAEKMQLSAPSVVSFWKKRGVPNEVVLKVALEKGINERWIKTGQGEKYARPPAEAVNEHHDACSRQPLSKDELELVKLYRQLHSAEKEKIIEIAQLYGGVKELRGYEDGENNSKESNSR